MRRALLAASNSTWMRERATRYPFVRRAVTRFMPGETLDEALVAAKELQARGLASVITWLGENVTDEAKAASVAAHYVGALDRVRDGNLDAEISIKLTHLGLDLGQQFELVQIAVHVLDRGDAVPGAPFQSAAHDRAVRRLLL